MAENENLCLQTHISHTGDSNYPSFQIFTKNYINLKCVEDLLVTWTSLQKVPKLVYLSGSPTYKTGSHSPLSAER
jgi:hypothetical protein